MPGSGESGRTAVTGVAAESRGSHRTLPYREWASSRSAVQKGLVPGWSLGVSRQRW